MGDLPQPKDADYLLENGNQTLLPSSHNTEETDGARARDHALVIRVLAGEQERYYELVAPHERKIYVIAFSILRNQSDAEDCVQEAVLKAFHHLDQFRGESRFGSWLVRITINEAKMRLRKLRAHLYESLDDNDDEDKKGDYLPRVFGDWREIPSEALERKEIGEMLVNAVESLGEKYREVFVLRDVEGNDVATTAEILGISEVSVKTRLLRARLQLRDIVSPMLQGSRLPGRELFKKGKNPWR